MTMDQVGSDPGTARWSRRRGLFLVLVMLACSVVMTTTILPAAAYPFWNGVVAVLTVVVARRCGLTWRALGIGSDLDRRGVLVGVAAVAVVLVAFTIALVTPELRQAFGDERAADVGTGAMLWAVLVRIPVGTVLLEEVAFRGVLPALFRSGDRGWWSAAALASACFGLWHVLPSLSLSEGNDAVGALFGDATLVTSLTAVLATFVLGLVLCGVRRLGGGLLAPVLGHLASNSGAFLLAWLLHL
ncbi:CPBP family intramembrane glutamic endopeptidase [Actinoalloteichus spitiensis]|uniref:CPBP family intramembrane glutamic endopeptidase n=1 Tax=Actinoalloteichus spitiensis TaxID=252394 RepID=UPI000360518F|nr:CPBP family intramembrane glutamic endopeptidase [Actinoalloteichus spitiensis]